MFFLIFKGIVVIITIIIWLWFLSLIFLWGPLSLQHFVLMERAFSTSSEMGDGGGRRSQLVIKYWQLR